MAVKILHYLQIVMMVDACSEQPCRGRPCGRQLSHYEEYFHLFGGWGVTVGPVKNQA